MELPYLIVDGPVEERLVSVDGAWGQPGLNLSHWPGNTTPEALRHDLSTGVALAFGRLRSEERSRLAAGCRAIANNHFDTDGACAMFATRFPALALPRAERLLATAAAGDFYQVPSEEAFALDAAITNLADPERSPWSDRFRGLDTRARHAVALEGIAERLPALLDGGFDGALAEFEDLWRNELERLRTDLADLRAATRDDVVHLDLCVWESRPGARFAPGRHALFGSTKADRVLAIGPAGGGVTYRLLLSTLSWFDLVSRDALPRPDLASLAERLNEAEGSQPTDSSAWRTQENTNASPELWFGAAELESFAEHSCALRESRLGPAVVRRAVSDALRACWVFPE
jgi:hypothetical protein